MADKLVIVFDLMGTLLDLSALDPQFEKAFGEKRARQEWFGEVQALMFSITATGGYEPFSDIAEAALRILQERRRKHLSDDERQRILISLREVPPFADVKPALQQLREKGYRLATLTNSAEKSARQAIEAAGLSAMFDDVLSVESVKRMKPAAEPYLMAAKTLAVKPAGMLLVAAHAWDIRGAMRAGLRGCFVRRADEVLDTLTSKPEYDVPGLGELVSQLGD